MFKWLKRNKTKVLTTETNVVNIITIKGEQMSQADLKPGTVVNAPVFTDTAIGVFRDLKKGGWWLAKIRYNPETGEVGKLEKEHAGDERMIANERFKITAIKEKVVS